jgi:hypothetical protein
MTDLRFAHFFNLSNGLDLDSDESEALDKALPLGEVLNINHTADLIVNHLMGMDVYDEVQNLNEHHQNVFNSTINFATISLLLKDSKINNLNMLDAMKAYDTAELFNHLCYTFEEFKQDPQFAAENNIDIYVLEHPDAIASYLLDAFFPNLDELTPEIKIPENAMVH